ncbi:MAG: hypothetical protein ACHQJ6_03805 [Candidatus Berkiellales bacterium]
MKEYYKYPQQLAALLVEKPEESFTISDAINHVAPLFGLRSLWQKTYHGLTAQVSQLLREDQPLKALNLLLEGLGNDQFWHHHAKKWWHLMRLAVEITQTLKLAVSNPFCKPIQRLLKLSTLAPQPWQGSDVAFCFSTFSLWSFIQGKTQKAILQINNAIHADLTWGYSEYLLGWYGLALEGIDPVSHFVKAIKIDRRYFEQLKNDPLCRAFPDVLALVEQEVSKSDGKHIR